VVRLDSETTVTQFVLPNDELTSLQKITLAGTNGGAYELLYSLRKFQGSLADHVIGPKSLWPSLGKRTAGEDLNARSSLIDNQTISSETLPNFTAMVETLDGTMMKGTKTSF